MFTDTPVSTTVRIPAPRSCASSPVSWKIVSPRSRGATTSRGSGPSSGTIAPATPGRPRVRAPSGEFASDSCAPGSTVQWTTRAPAARAASRKRARVGISALSRTDCARAATGESSPSTPTWHSITSTAVWAGVTSGRKSTGIGGLRSALSARRELRDLRVERDQQRVEVLALDDRHELGAPQRELAHRAVEVDVDHLPGAADLVHAIVEIDVLVGRIDQAALHDHRVARSGRLAE